MSAASSPPDIHFILERFVAPFYLKLLHGNFARDAGDRLHDKIAEAARTISDPALDLLLRTSEWRGRLSAAWFIGLSGRTHYVDRLAELLIESELVYAGQGFCIALGLIGGSRSAAHLRRYLEAYLPPAGRDYDQEWAAGALKHILGTLPPDLSAPAMWNDGTVAIDAERGSIRVANIVSYLLAHEMIAVMSGGEPSAPRPLAS